MPGLTSGLLESQDHPCCVQTVIFRSLLLMFLIVVYAVTIPSARVVKRSYTTAVAATALMGGHRIIK